MEYGRYLGTFRLYVVKGSGPTLLGRDWLSKIQLDWNSIKAVAVSMSLSQMLERFQPVLDPGMGVMTQLTAHLTLKEHAEPRFFKLRPIPFAIKDRVGREPDRLEESGVLQRVKHADWAARIVPVLKKDGSLRLCGDYKVTINSALQVDQYPLPRPADLMACLTGERRFSKLDLTAAYQQMPLDADSRRLVTINTHHSLYHGQYTWLPFGVASAPAVFQRAMDTILQGVPEVICYLDDILVTRKSEAEHLHNLEAVLKRLQHHGVRLWKDKCAFLQKA